MAGEKCGHWRQGNVLTGSALNELANGYTIDRELAVIISHDCDIARMSDSEPVVELIQAGVVSKLDSNFLLAKNPRRLHWLIQRSGRQVIVDLLAHQKFSVSKDELLKHQPDVTFEVTGAALTVLQSWLIARYRRPALPDSLVKRTRKLFDYIKRNGTKSHNSAAIIGVWLDYEPKVEISSTEPYELWLDIVYTIDDPSAQTTAQNLADDINSAIENLLNRPMQPDAIDLRRCGAVSEQEFTLRDLRSKVQYRYEHISHRPNSPGPTANWGS